MNQFQSPVTSVFAELIRGSCAYAERLHIKEAIGDRIDKITVTPNMADLPILIGSGGRQAKAYTALFRAAGEMVGKPTEYHLEESYEGKRDPKMKVIGKFSESEFLGLFRRLTTLLFGTPPTQAHRLRDIGSERVFEITMDIGLNPSETHFNIVTALNDVCYPYGKRRGVRIEVRRRRYNVGT